MPHAFTRWLPTTARSGWRPQLTQLEDRTTPVTISGNTVTLNKVNENVAIFTNTAGTYTLDSSFDGPQSFTPAAGLVTVVDSATSTGVYFRDSSVDYANSFAITLDDAPERVQFNGATSFGDHDLSVTTFRNVIFGIGSRLNTSGGNITLSANQQAVAYGGSFVGVEVGNGAAVSSVTGTVSVSGRGGNFTSSTQVGVRVNSGTIGTFRGTVSVTGTGGAGTADFNFGVQVVGGGSIIAYDSGPVSVTGTGGASIGNNNYGVQVLGSGTEIASRGGVVTVTGVGGGINGGSSATESNTNLGVFVNLGGRIAAGGAGAVSVTGTGGTSGSSGNSGVYVTDSGSAITSGGGSVTVTGTGGGTGLNNASGNHGVIVAAGGQIAAGGSGAVSVTGLGNTGGIFSPAVGNVGVFVTGTGSAITSGGGPVNIQGTDGTYLAVAVQEAGTIASVSNAPVTITTNTLGVIGTGTISAGTGTVTIQTLSAGTVIALGGGDDARHYPTSIITPVTLGLTDGELDLVTAGTLVIGRSNTANIRLVADITRPTSTAVRLITAGFLRSEFTGRFDTGGGPLTLTVGGNIIPTPAGNDYTAGTVTVSAGARLALEIDSAMANTRLDVTGTLNLTGLSLVLSGSYTPAVGDVFTLATATGITGTFTGLPNGATVALNEVTLRLTYTATVVTATAVSAPPPVRVVTAVGDTVRVQNPADGSTRMLVPFPGSRVSVASTDLNGDRVPDVLVGAGPGGGPHVRAFDGATGAELASFFAFAPAFRGGVNLAATAGRVVVGAGAGGGPHVKVIDATKLTQTQANGEIANSALLGSFFAFDVTFTGGVSVAVGELSFDGVPDVIVGAGAGGGPHVKVIDGNRLNVVQPSGVIANDALRANFFAFDPAFSGGVNVAATTDLFAVGAGAGGEPQVKLYQIRGGNILTDVRSVTPFDSAFRGGVRVGFANADADTDIDLLTAAGPGGGPHLKAFNLAPFAEVQSVFVGDAGDTRGVVV